MADTTSSVRSSSSPARASACHGGVDGLGPLGPLGLLGPHGPLPRWAAGPLWGQGHEVVPGVP